ncbi:unnamed protein product [Ceratitis capitata]|uniref:(Mediterranean fruit fly) hypothetical protein n=1 Tax=Ceratitis capitata TaxID=7213 RepID=A0A811V452_CERCA|nr:unnamed protein product [Ceratitis capitata]
MQQQQLQPQICSLNCKLHCKHSQICNYFTTFQLSAVLLGHLLKDKPEKPGTPGTPGRPDGPSTSQTKSSCAKPATQTARQADSQQPTLTLADQPEHSPPQPEASPRSKV